VDNNIPSKPANTDSFNGIGLIDQQIKLLKERGIHTYLNRDIGKFEKYFARLKELLDLPATNERFDEAYELFYRIFDAVPLMYHRLSDIPIFRAARNKIGEVFTSQSRISYNKNTDQIGPGKFNAWYQPMFYGCLPYRPQVEKEYPEPRLVVALECCKDLYRHDNTLLVQDITIGRWHIQPAVGVVTAPHQLGVVRIYLFPIFAFISLWCGDNTDHKLNKGVPRPVEAGSVRWPADYTPSWP